MSLLCEGIYSTSNVSTLPTEVCRRVVPNAGFSLPVSESESTAGDCQQRDAFLLVVSRGGATIRTTWHWRMAAMPANETRLIAAGRVRGFVHLRILLPLVRPVALLWLSPKLMNFATTEI